jgi:hypothetical protein
MRQSSIQIEVFADGVINRNSSITRARALCAEAEADG